jgi:hypothetical protein
VASQKNSLRGTSDRFVEKDESRKDAVRLFARQTFYLREIAISAITPISGQKLADIQEIVKIPLW